MDLEPKLRQDVQRFLEVYKFLSAEGKAQFEAQMAGAIKGQDDKTRKLYHALLEAAKLGLEVPAAVEEMRKASPA